MNNASNIRLRISLGDRGRSEGREGKMGNPVEVKWSAEDGYVGKDRPKWTEIDASDFINLSRAEAEALFDEIMEENFRQEVTWACHDYEGSLNELMEAAAKMAKEEADVND
jgi:hypothetical protein